MTATLDGRTAVAVDVSEDPNSPFARLAACADPGTLRPVWTDPGTGVVGGLARMHGTDVVLFASDAKVQGGALGGAGCAAIVAAYELAIAHGSPVIGIWHSGGARLQEGIGSLDGVGRVFAAMTRASGRIPQLSLVLGPAAGGAAYGPALTDIVVLGPRGRVFVTGPDVVRSVTGESVDMLRLGGPEPHGRRSGVAHVVAQTDEDAYRTVRELAGLLGRPGTLGPVAEREFAGLLPASKRRGYDIRPVVDTLLDRPGVELHPRWAPNVVTTLGRLGGRSVGVLANNPLRLAGCLDAAAADKAARFVRTCDAFGVPLAVLVDVPGYLPGVGQEWDGVVRRGAKLLHAFAEARVPRVTVLLRKAYGGAYIAMNSRSLGATAVLAWPEAEIAVMGATAAVRILHRRRLAELPETRRGEVETELASEHERLAGGIDRAIDTGLVDRRIDPDRTRGAVAGAFAAALADAPDARGRHGNIPL